MKTTLLLISNAPNSYRQGEVIAAYDGNITLTDGIDKRTFEAAHPDKQWDNRSVLVRLLGVGVDDPKVQSLLEDSDNGLTRRKSFILPQDSSSPYYTPLLNDAYIETTIEIIGGLLRA